MPEILVSQLKAGKFYTKPVFLDDKYILFSPETPISDEILSRLRDWKIDYVQTEGEPVEEMVITKEDDTDILDELNDTQEDTGISEVSLSASQQYFLEGLNFLESIFSTYVKDNTLSVNMVTQHVKILIERVSKKQQYMLRITEFQSDAHNYIVVHSVKTAIVAIAIGATMRMPAYRLIELGTAALMHEIGMIKLPAAVYMSNKMLSPIEKKAIRAHTVLGYKLLKQNSFPMTVCLGVMECRENADGSGYPRGLTSERISLYGKIINVASAYAALTSKRPFRGAFNGHSSILDMLKRKDTVYDGGVLKVLIMLLSLYPLGTYVLLKNGARGMVVEANQGNYKAPKVQLLLDTEGGVEKDQKIITTEASVYEIVRPLSNEEISKVKKLLG